MGGASLQDDATSTEIFWKMIKELSKKEVKSSSVSLFPQLTLSGPGMGLFDFALLPQFDTVRKYFGLSVFYGVSRQDGFFFEFKDINIGGTSN